MHRLKEVDMLATKMDLLMKILDERTIEKREVMHIHDSNMTCEECGETRHTDTNYPEVREDMNYIINYNNNNYRPQQNQGQSQQHKRPNYSGNYLGTYQGNNFYNNANQTPLRELVLNQGKLMDNLSKKLASNDKTLESINIRMASFSNAIKNHLSFNKMLESQKQQLASFAIANDEGKIPRHTGELETANLIGIFNVESYWSNPPRGIWLDSSLPTKKGDLGRPVIPISIGSANFNEAICDFSASINIMPKVIYEKLFNYPLSRTTMCLQLADQSLCYPMAIMEEICV